MIPGNSGMTPAKNSEEIFLDLRGQCWRLNFEEFRKFLINDHEICRMVQRLAIGTREGKPV